MTDSLFFFFSRGLVAYAEDFDTLIAADKG